MKKFILLCTLLCFALVSFPKNTKETKKHISKVLKGSRRSQLTQNRVANKEHLSRIKNDKQLKKMETGRRLLKITSKVKVDCRLKPKFRYVRPETDKFLADMGTTFKKKFHKKLKVNSAVRTVVYQQKLGKRNGNAAKPTGPTASSHPTGATVDVAKKGLTKKQLDWVRKFLATYEDKRMIEATEEKNQPVFHFMVFETYRRDKELLNSFLK